MGVPSVGGGGLRGTCAGRGGELQGAVAHGSGIGCCGGILYGRYGGIGGPGVTRSFGVALLGAEGPALLRACAALT